MDPHLVVVQLNVVADTTAERTGGIIDDLQGRFWFCGGSTHAGADCVLTLAVIFWWCLVLLFFVRTGRTNGKRSAEGPALATATDPAGHEASCFNLRPGRQLG